MNYLSRNWLCSVSDELPNEMAQQRGRGVTFDIIAPFLSGCVPSVAEPLPVPCTLRGPLEPVLEPMLLEPVLLECNSGWGVADGILEVIVRRGCIRGRSIWADRRCLTEQYSHTNTNN